MPTQVLHIGGLVHPPSALEVAERRLALGPWTPLPPTLHIRH